MMAPPSVHIYRDLVSIQQINSCYKQQFSNFILIILRVDQTISCECEQPITDLRCLSVTFTFMLILHYKKSDCILLFLMQRHVFTWLVFSHTDCCNAPLSDLAKEIN